ncbi:MAG: argininosuccinate lyase [Candidatus Sumerlaeota bacterium]|nr:argininosuccinate lyase [Candidatus Sumerlaeota bacterium]
MSSPSSGGPVWAKRVGDAAIGAENVAFCAGWDVRARPEADHALIPHDLSVNAAHAIMLGEQGILTDAERRAILDALLAIRDHHAAGGAILRPDCEDVHMSVEALVTEKAGAGMGGRLHTGRSRNDQVATDMRLWLRDEAAGRAAEIALLIETLLDHAATHAASPCPGFTHMQPGMISTWGHWAAAYAARLLRGLAAFGAVVDALDECPLGAAASYGSRWPTNRERTAALLGFARPTNNTVDAIWARGELEARFAFAAAQLLGHLSGIGQDLILLSTPPRDWVRLPDEFVTGSSIMPQKRNPDFAEVTRAKAAAAAGIVQAFLGIATAAPLGYNRDTQWTKYLALDIAEEVRGAARIYAGVFDRLDVRTAKMRDACREGFLNATDVADFLAASRGLAFRDCYRVLGRAVKRCEEAGELTLDAINAELAELGTESKPLAPEEMAALTDPEKLVAARTQTGSPNPANVRASIEVLRAESSELAEGIAKKAAAWHAAIDGLWKLAAQD